LVAVERGWRDMKGALRLRSVFHHHEDRIRSHVQLCWLARLLMRVVENACGDTWRNIRVELERMHLVTLAREDGTVAPRSLTTPAQRAILSSLELPEHPGSRPSRRPRRLLLRLGVVTRPRCLAAHVSPVRAHSGPSVCPSSSEVGSWVGYVPVRGRA
jgi:hypothetical protein